MNVDAAREGLLAQVRDEARELLAQADADAAAAIDGAHRQADEILGRAREQGAVEGRIEASREEAFVRTLARMEVLAAQREGYDAVRARARAGALALRDDPGYRELLERLAAAARRDLGDGARIEVDPDGAGGVRAESGSRRVDYTLETLADRCLEAIGPAARRLWA